MTSPTTLTLLDLVQTVNLFAVSDTEIVATAIYLVNSGKVRLGGNFAGATIALPDTPEMTPQRVYSPPAAVRRTAFTAA